MIKFEQVYENKSPISNWLYNGVKIKIKLKLKISNDQIYAAFAGAFKYRVWRHVLMTSLMTRANIS